MTKEFTLLLDSTKLGESFVLGSGCEPLPELSGNLVAVDHARLSRKSGGWRVQDLGTQAGTLLNGKQVYGVRPVVEGDILTIDDNTITLRGPSEAGNLDRRKNRPSSNTPVMLIKGVSVRVRKAVLLDNINITVHASEFVGILGPSGCGKSTLMKVVAGLVPPSEGAVLLKPKDHLGQQVLSPVAYLPQDLIVHDQLSVGSALEFVSALKSSSGALAADRAAVDGVISQVALLERVRQPIKNLSGGEKRRVGLAAELLGNPRIIVLDEATSGLDPHLDAELMDLFRELADAGKTVLCVTHNPARLHLCHRVIFMASGKVLFDGSPDQLVEAMEVGNLDEAYRRVAEAKAEKQLDDLSRLLTRKCHSPSAPDPAYNSDLVVSSGSNTAAKPFSWSLLLGQLKLLVARYSQLIINDWRNLLLLVGQAPVIGLLAVATFGNIRADFAELHATRLKEVFLILSLAVLWCSGTASIREIVKEWPLLRHEQRYGLFPSGVLLSKVLLLGSVAILQASLLLLIVKVGCNVVGNWPEQLVVLSVLGSVGALQGLCVSSLAGTSERAMTVLPVLLIGEAILSGGFATLVGPIRLFSQVANPVYWALDGLRATLGTELLIATYPGAPGSFQPPILGLSGPLFLDLAMLCSQGLAIFGLTYLCFCAGLSNRGLVGFLSRMDRIVTAGKPRV